MYKATDIEEYQREKFSESYQSFEALWSISFMKGD